MEASPRTSKAANAEKKTPYVILSDFLRKYRLAVIGLFGAAVLAVIVVAVVTAISESQIAASAAVSEKLDTDYATYEAESDQAKKADLEKSFIAEADSAIKAWPRRFASLRAYSYEAKIAAAKSDWATAEKDWLAIETSAPASFLAPVALQQAAVAAEEGGAPDRALADYKRFVDKYAKTSIGLPHAYFAIGRLSEATKDYASALAAYQKIDATWPDSDWTKLAMDRIIFLKSQGLQK